MIGFEQRLYLMEITRRVPTKWTLQEIIDILARYRYTTFVLYSEREIGEDEIDFGRLSAYCQMQDVELMRLDRSGYDALLLAGDAVCVSTEASRSLSGRVEEMRERMIAAEAQGRVRRAKRFIVTDFSDGCDWQPLAASLPGIVMGGNFALSGGKSSKMDLERELDAVMDAPLGGLLLKLGTLYLRGGALRAEASEYFNILAGDVGYSRHPGLTQIVLDEVSGIANGIRIAAERWTERSNWAKEIVYMANLLDCACHRRDETRLRAVRDEHGRIWRLRYNPEGRVDSLSKLPRF